MRTFHISARIKLASCEEVKEFFSNAGGEHVSDLKALYGLAVIAASKALDTPKMFIEFLEIKPQADKMLFFASALTNEGDFREIEFTSLIQKGMAFSIHQLLKYLELQARQENGTDFVSVVSIKIIPMDKDDLLVSMF